MQNIFQFIANNFVDVAPILALCIIAVAIVLERFSAVVMTYPLPNVDGFFERVRDLIMADRLAEAIALCDKYPEKPVAQVARTALLRAHQPETLIMDGLEIAVGKATQQIQKRTGFLSAIANVSTLLGLLGTILGLINAFQAVGNATAQERSALLAQGISVAMNATMLGLVVAIPSMIAYSFLMNRSNRLVSETETAAVQILDLIKQRYYSAEIESSPEQKGSLPFRKAG